MSDSRHLRERGTSALFVVMLCIAGQAQDRANSPPAPAETKHPIARKLTLDGVPNFGEVTPTLYRGAQPTKDGLRNLAKMGINIVVDLRGSRESEHKLVTDLGMQYVPASLALLPSARRKVRRIPHFDPRKPGQEGFRPLSRR